MLTLLTASLVTEVLTVAVEALLVMVLSVTSPLLVPALVVTATALLATLFTTEYLAGQES